MAKYILFDTETTGVEEKDRIIQVGSMIIEPKTKVKIFDELCSCEIPISIEAMETHGITPLHIQNKPKFIETNFYRTLKELNNEENFLIAHNISFDLSMLEKEGFKNKIQLIDTLRCSKHVFSDAKAHRLQYFRYHLKLYELENDEALKYNIQIKAHNAIGDVLIMKLFLSKLVQKIKDLYPTINPMNKLVELSKTPVLIEKFNFGKYKGKKIIEVCNNDMNYINWMLDNLDLDEDIKYTIDKAMGHI